MSKIVQVLFFALLAAALCSAASPRSRTSPLKAKNNRLARQEVSEAVTPYPTADELKPEVPFDEAAAPEEPQSIQPDEVYGPPEDETRIETVNVAAAEDEQSFAEEGTAEEEKRVAAAEDSNPARLTARRATSPQRSSVRPAKLRKALPARLQLKPQFVPQPVFYYVAQ